MSEVQVFEGNAQTTKQIGSETVNISIIEGWSDLEDLQQIWLSTYFDNYPNQSITCLKCGVSDYKLGKWKQNSTFNSVFQFIKKLKTDELASIHYQESRVDSKIRGQVLKAVKAEGYESKKESTTNNLTVVGETTMAKLAKELDKLGS